MSNGSKVVAFAAKGTVDGAISTARANGLVNQLRNKAAEQLKQLFQSMFDHLDDFLFDMADKSSGAKGDQNTYFDAMRHVRLKKEAMRDVFIAKFVNGYNDTGKKDDKRDPGSLFGAGSLDGLLLVNDEELEESLAISNVVTKARSHHKESLFALEQRFAALLDDRAIITGEAHPVGPKTICDAFKGAVKTLEADFKVKLIVYKLFDRYLINELGNCYFELNKMFMDAGILPAIRVRAPTHAPSARSTGGTAQATGAPSSGMAQGNSAPMPGGAVEMFNSLQQMLMLQRGGTGHATSTAGGVSGNVSVAYDTPTVLVALSALQHAPNEKLGELKGTDQISAWLKSNIVGHLSTKVPGSAKDINQADADTIDIVTMLFDFILDDKTLPDAFKALIARLQIPVLKVGIIDKTFFSKKTHPARRLLNELARAGIGWNISGDQQADPLYNKVSEIVNRVLNEFSNDVRLFTALADDFSAYIETEMAQRKVAAERLAAAKESVATEIEKRISETELPFSIRGFFTTAWKDVLTVIHTRDGNHGVAWQAALQLADDLVWSVQRKIDAKQKQRLVQMIPKILNGLQDGLTLISYPRPDKERLFRELENLHIASLKGETASRTSTPATPAKTPIDQLIDDISTVPTLLEEIVLEEPAQYEYEPERAAGYDEHTDLVTQLTLGTWVEFVTAENQVVRGKLAWKSEVLGEYTFVDRTYKVVADKSLQELAADFRNLRASVVADVPLLDRALDAVVTGLKRMTTREAATVN